MELKVSNRTIVRVVVITLASVVAVKLVGTLRTQLAWILTALFLALALEPAVNRLSRVLPKRSRGLAVGLVLLAVTAVIAFIALALTPPFAGQLYHLVQNLPQAYEDFAKQNPDVRSFINSVMNTESTVGAVRQFSNQLLSAGGSAVVIVKGIFGGVVALLTVLLLTFYMVLEGPRWIAAMWAQVPADRRSRYMPLAQQLHGTITGFVGGIALTGSIAAAVSTVALLLIQAPYALALGLLVGIVELVPMIGATIAGIFVVSAVLVFKGVWAAVIMAIFYILYQQFENYVLQPMVFSRTLEVSPLTVLLALIFGASLAGFIGALVAIPVAASAQILVKYWLSRNAIRNAKAKTA
jgi:predicted PurR-regulated permease PerM